MATFTYQSSLLEEFESLLKIAESQKLIRCHGKAKNRQGKNKKTYRCKRKFGNTKQKLATKCEEIIEVLDQESGDIEGLLEDASSLVVCTQNHRAYAVKQFEIWMGKVNFLDISEDDYSSDGDEAEPSYASSLPQDVNDDESSFEEEVAIVARNNNIRYSSPSPSDRSISNDTESDDNGYHSGDEEDLTVASRAPRPSAHGDRSVRNPYLTPKKNLLRGSNDSGISMSYMTPDVKSEAIDVDPLSPSAGRSRRDRQLRTNSQPKRPAATPIQVKEETKEEIKDETKEDTFLVKLGPRHFQRFRHPAKELIDFLKMPLCKTALTKGYIYTFELENDCPYYKIGFTAQGKKDKTLEHAIERRMRQHAKCGWQKPKVNFKIKVPHAYKVEQIVFKHLAAARLREVNMSQGVNGKQCDHGSHKEWFDAPLNKIHETIRAWTRWIKTKPYIEVNGKYELSIEWETKLEEVSAVTGDGRDCWLDWLAIHAPAAPLGLSPQPKNATKASIHARRRVKYEGSDDELKLSSIATAPLEITDSKDDVDGHHRPKKNISPQFKMKLRSSKT